jgi:hypothetical protein
MNVQRGTTDILLVVLMKINGTRIGYSMAAAVCTVLLLVTFPTLASCECEAGTYIMCFSFTLQISCIYILVVIILKKCVLVVFCFILMDCCVHAQMKRFVIRNRHTARRMHALIDAKRIASIGAPGLLFASVGAYILLAARRFRIANLFICACMQ